MNNLFSSIRIKPSTQEGGNQSPTTTGDVDLLSLDEQEKKRYGQDTRYRKILAHWVMSVVSLWLLLVLLVITFNKIWCLNISESVCITLLATTTVNVLGLAFIVLNGIFGGNRPSHRRKR